MSNERQELWNALKEQGLVHTDLPEKTTSYTPWFTKIITVFGSWLAALFLGIFLGLFSYIFDSSILSFLFGAILILGCTMMFKKKDKSEFLSHMLLPISLIGQLSIGVSIAQEASLIEHEVLGISLCCGLVQLVLIKIMNNEIHRIWSTLMTALSLSFVLYELDLLFIMQPLLLSACIYVWWNMLRFDTKYDFIRPVGYGLIVATLGSIGYLHMGLLELFYFDAGISEITTGCVFLGLVLMLLRRYTHAVSMTISISCVLLSIGLVTLSYNAIGVTTASSIVMLGFLNRNRFLMVIGGSVLISCLSFYYYTLSITLLEKSLLLAALSAAILAVRFVFQKNTLDKESTHVS